MSAEIINTAVRAATADGHRPRRLRRSVPVAVLAAAGLVTAGFTTAPAALAAGSTTFGLVGVKADDGAKVVAEKKIDSRTVDLTIDSPAIGGNTTVRLLLPKDWSTQTSLSFPALYLLHGANEPADYKSWTTFTDVESFSADKNVLVVLPSDGLAGYYTDPVPGGPKGPKWETYHTKELPQLLQRAYRANGSNAVAGISIGGLGALVYPARHPGLYKAAASWSGLTDTLDLAGTISITAARQAAKLDADVWGPRLTNLAQWHAHNPNDLLPQMAKSGTKFYVSAGDGQPGPLDHETAAQTANGDKVAVDEARLGEMFVGGENRAFVARMQKAKVDVTPHLYTGGWHNWSYWERELHTSWPFLSAALGNPTVTRTASVEAVSERTSGARKSRSGFWHGLFG